MKILIPLLSALIGIAPICAQTPDWENPGVIGINKLPYNATLSLGEHAKSLNGKWSFCWSANPEQRPVDFYSRDYDASTWDKINVPGNWQTQGYDKPIYTNWTYPFAKDHPKVTSTPPEWYYSYEHRNPVGSYITDFTLDCDPTEKTVYLHFDGVKSAMYVWVNGKLVGYSQNSMGPAEFDITPYVEQGQNRLAVEVYRWSDGSYIEDQDMWRLSGIFRDVTLLERPTLNIRDYQVQSQLSDDYKSAAVSIDVCVRNSARKAQSGTLQVDVDGKSYSIAVPKIKAGQEKWLNLTADIDNPKLWSAEKPNLIDLKLTLGDESISDKIGLRRVEIRDNALWENGAKVKLRGVNRHEHHPLTGRYVDEATMRRDLELLKQGNVNMVRTSHYPNTPLWYSLCDEYGIYIMDEANHESHDYGIGTTTFGDDPQWRKAMVDRAAALVHRDKNHPCVILWSLGNEATAGDNVKAMADTVREIDPNTPIYYDSDLSVSNIFDDAYAKPARFAKMVSTVKDKPVMMREYAHAMGNSLGNLQEYWDIIYANDNAIGAAIWDWVDQGLKCVHPDRKIPTSDFAYGGDFGDTPNDGPFNINGIIDADRVPHPHYYQMQKVYQPIKFSLADHAIQLTNRLAFTPLSDFNYSYEYVSDGDVVAQGALSLSGYKLLLPDAPKGEGELFLNVYASLPQAEIWAPKGHIVAKEQFEITPGKQDTASKVASTVTVDTPGNGYLLSGGDIVCRFSEKGDLMSWHVKDVEQLAAPMVPTFWKMPVENDRRSNYESRQWEWRDAADQRRLISSGMEGDTLRFVTKLEEPGAIYTLSYWIVEDGLAVQADYEPYVCFKSPIPRFGFRLGLPKDMDQISWYGRGPVENYPDRKTCALIGKYSMPLEQFITNYPMPQENANRCDVRWCTFTDTKDNQGVKLLFAEPGNFRAWPYLEHSVWNAKHPSELEDCGYININIDQYIQGVGGCDSWGALPLDEYMIDSHLPLRMCFTLSHIDLK